jgi:hypothetical protein
METNLTRTRQIRLSNSNARRPCYIPHPVLVTLQRMLDGIRGPLLRLLAARR